MGESLVDKKRIRIIDTYRIIYLFTAIIMFLVTEFGRFIYRPYIYKNDINDYGLADSIGNLGGVIVQIFATLAITNLNPKKGSIVISLIVIGYILYEFLQPFLPKGVFDWKDVFGTLAGGMISFIIFHLIRYAAKNKVIYRL